MEAAQDALIRQDIAGIDAVQAEYIRAANEALANARDEAARWWSYTVSHCHFELLVGEPNGRDNLVICMAPCDSIAGPVWWSNRRLQVARPDDGLTFVLADDTVGFRVVGGGFNWRRGYDLLKHGSLSVPRRSEDGRGQA